MYYYYSHHSLPFSILSSTYHVPDVFIERARLLKARGSPHEALTLLEREAQLSELTALVNTSSNGSSNQPSVGASSSSSLASSTAFTSTYSLVRARAALLAGQWVEEDGTKNVDIARQYFELVRQGVITCHIHITQFMYYPHVFLIMFSTTAINSLLYRILLGC